MVVGLILVRTSLGGNRLIPFLGIAEERVDIEDYAAKRIDAMPHDLADGIFGIANLVHVAYLAQWHTSKLWRSIVFLLNMRSCSQFLLQITSGIIRPWPGLWRQRGAPDRPPPWLVSRLRHPASCRRSSRRRCHPAWRRGFSARTQLLPDQAKTPAWQSPPGSDATTMHRRSPSGTSCEIAPRRQPGRKNRRTDRRTV